MTALEATAGTLADLVLAAPRSGRRRLVALAGGPASGKSTLAGALAQRLSDTGCAAQVVPMDGYHLHNPVLLARGLLDRKGAPETFDVAGFLHLVTRLHDEPEVFHPTFDRPRDIAIAASGVIGPLCDTVIVEGNYLLFDEPVWRELHAHWDFSIKLDVPMDILKSRLVDRWLDHGLTADQAEIRAEKNDMANARKVSNAPLPASIVV
jgi:fructokinase